MANSIIEHNSILPETYFLQSRPELKPHCALEQLTQLSIQQLQEDTDVSVVSNLSCINFNSVHSLLVDAL